MSRDPHANGIVSLFGAANDCLFVVVCSQGSGSFFEGLDGWLDGANSIYAHTACNTTSQYHWTLERNARPT